MAMAAMTPLILSGSVGDRGTDNKPADVLAVRSRLAAIRQASEQEGIPLNGTGYIKRPVAFAMELAGPPSYPSRFGGGSQFGLTTTLDEALVEWIRQFQSLFMKFPDGIVQPGGVTAKFLSNWRVSPISTDVEWQGNLKTAWLMVSPLLPTGSYCSSGFRSPEKQKRIMDDYFLKEFARELKSKLGKRYDEIVAMTGDQRYVSMAPELKAIDQPVALPGRSLHGRGKAFDIGKGSNGEEFRNEQMKICRMVAGANSRLFSGRIIKERKCVHVEIV